jgi:hypothetical protein
MGIGCNSCRLRFLGSTTTLGFSGASGTGASSFGGAIRARGGNGEAFATKGSSSASREPVGSGAGGGTWRDVSSAADFAVVAAVADDASSTRDALDALEAFGASEGSGCSSSSSGCASAFLRGARAFLGADGSFGARGIWKWV